VLTPSCWFLTSSQSTPRQRVGSIFSVTLLETRPGFILFRVEGKGASRLFANESGGHRWQRIPPTEKRGRVHSSTVTVAVLPEPSEQDFWIDPRDVEETFTGSGGRGGQHVNRTSTAVVLWHRPSGIRVRIEGRSQNANRRAARDVLRARLKAARTAVAQSERNSERRSQLGSGMRGDKVRTIQVRRGLVTDHRTQKTTSFSRYRRGLLRDLL
jgi:peptide chain release factor 1